MTIKSAKTTSDTNEQSKELGLDNRVGWPSLDGDTHSNEDNALGDYYLYLLIRQQSTERHPPT